MEPQAGNEQPDFSQTTHIQNAQPRQAHTTSAETQPDSKPQETEGNQNVGNYENSTGQDPKPETEPEMPNLFASPMADRAETLSNQSPNQQMRPEQPQNYPLPISLGSIVWGLCLVVLGSLLFLFGSGLYSATWKLLPIVIGGAGLLLLGTAVVTIIRNTK